VLSHERETNVINWRVAISKVTSDKFGWFDFEKQKVEEIIAEGFCSM